MLISPVGSNFVNSNRSYSYNCLNNKEDNEKTENESNEISFKGLNLSGGAKKGLFVAVPLLFSCFFWRLSS